MSSFWAGWVMVLVVINYTTVLFLFLWAPWVKIPTEADGTTGHTWANGAIREGLHQLPKWWLVMSTIGFISFIVYLVRYPGFGNWEGITGWTSTQQLHEEIADNNSKKIDLVEVIKGQSVLELSKNAQAMKLGERLFDDNCAACHGYEAQGSQLLGAPKLTDNTWLYGGKVDDIIHTITYGRSGVMPGWAAMLGEGGIYQVSNYVISLSGLTHDAQAAAAGQKLFASTCVACHGMEAHGNPMLGAPNLADSDWLYGSSLTTVAETIRNGRNGHMPAWSSRLNEQQIKVVAAWVLSHDNTAEALAAGDK